ncbi:MAG: hypothetical protein AAGG02_07340 [Cyanobacteria bacterium P01_H01_bin.15]
MIKCLVVFFAADEDDIDSEDVQYADIGMASARHILAALGELAAVNSDT